MHQDIEKVKLLARDLRDGKEFPRSPRATLGGTCSLRVPWTNAELRLWTGKANIIRTARLISDG